MNVYGHSALLVLQGPNGHCEFLLSCRRVTLSDPLLMVFYGLALIPLLQNLWDVVPEAVQPWYADNMAIAGEVFQLPRVVWLLQEQGPHPGYFPETKKPILLCHPDRKATLQAQLGEFNFLYHVARYNSGLLGSEAEKGVWVTSRSTPGLLESVTWPKLRAGIH